MDCENLGLICRGESPEHWVIVIGPLFLVLILNRFVFSVSFPADSKSKRDVTEVGVFTCSPFHSSGGSCDSRASPAFDMEYWLIDCFCIVSCRIRLMSHIPCRAKAISTPFRWVLKAALVLVSVRSQIYTLLSLSPNGICGNKLWLALQKEFILHWDYAP